MQAPSMDKRAQEDGPSASAQRTGGGLPSEFRTISLLAADARGRAGGRLVLAWAPCLGTATRRSVASAASQGGRDKRSASRFGHLNRYRLLTPLLVAAGGPDYAPAAPDGCYALFAGSTRGRQTRFELFILPAQGPRLSAWGRGPLRLGTNVINSRTPLPPKTRPSEPKAGTISILYGVRIPCHVPTAADAGSLLPEQLSIERN